MVGHGRWVDEQRFVQAHGAFRAARPQKPAPAAVLARGANRKAHFRRGQALVKLERVDEALADLRAAVHSRGSSMTTVHKLVMLHHRACHWVQSQGFCVAPELIHQAPLLFGREWFGTSWCSPIRTG